MVLVLFSPHSLLNDDASVSFLTLAFLKSGQLLLCRSSCLPLFLIFLLTHLCEVFAHLLYLHHVGMPLIWKLRQSAGQYIRAESSWHRH